MKLVISSGHAKDVPGAVGIINEVQEARRVVNHVAECLKDLGVDVVTFHDDESTSQDENLRRIVDFHNAQGEHDLDVSVHFNAYEPTGEPRGTEALYVSQEELAADLADAIAECGLVDRGGKYRGDLYFLNNTDAPAVLIEVCFVDSEADVDCYTERFIAICEAIADRLAEGP